MNPENNGLHPIKAQEGEKKKPRTPNVMDRIFDKLKYDVKKTEVLLGKYDIKKEVVLSQKALIKANIYCGIVEKTQGSIEVMGLLAGKWEGDILHIDDAYIGDCHSSHAYTEMPPTEIIKLNKLAKANNLNIVGQWHYHPQMSPHPSGTDDDFMHNLEKFKVRTPVQLITNLEDFTLTMMVNGRRKNVDFVVPPKIDTKLGLELGFVNHEGWYPERNEYRWERVYDPYTGNYTYESKKNKYKSYDPQPMEWVQFFGWVGRKTKWSWGWLIKDKKKEVVKNGQT